MAKSEKEKKEKYKKGQWDSWMLGVSYFDGGKVHETGGYYYKECDKAKDKSKKDYNKCDGKDVEVYVQSERVDGVVTQYRFNGRTFRDPILNFYGIENYGPGVAQRLKFYESHVDVRKKLARFSKGEDFSEHDLCPHVDLWLARAHFGKPKEYAELFFAVKGSRQLLDIAKYYDLPVPCDGALLEDIDDLVKYRARHLNIGPSKTLIPITVASLVQKNRRTVRFILYTFIRPWEFDEVFELPDF